MNAHTRPVFEDANGDITLTLGPWAFWQKVRLHGGPFDGYDPTENSLGVCVRAERVPKSADIRVPIHDFDVPRPADIWLVQEALQRAFGAALDGKDVYVGCMGGWGRTGLFLALCAKVAGEKDPVGFIRAHYTPKAVETAKQEAYVRDFDVAEVQAGILAYARKRWIRDVVFWWLPK